MTEVGPARARCEEHGLAYDPSIHSGCVVCRRGIEQPEVQVGQGTRSNKKLAVAALSLSVLAMAVLAGGSLWRFLNERALVEADGPSEPQVAQVVSSLPGIPEHRGTIMLGRKGHDEYGYPRDMPDKLTLLSLLRAERFEELSKHMELFQDAFEEDFKKEMWPMVAIDAFATADPELDPLLDRWVEATPSSFAPYAARAQHTIKKAWHYRGTKWARLTSKKRFRKMGRTLASVPADLNRAIELRPALVEARSLQFSLAKGLGADLETKGRILEEGLRHCPFCVGIRSAYLYSILPRWGGNFALVERKAKDAQYPAQNSKLRVLLGLADHAQCQLLGNREKTRAALGFCNRALEHGAYAPYLFGKASVLLELGRRIDAIEALTLALEVVPQSKTYLKSRGYALLKEERFDEAMKDLVLAARLDPVDAGVQKNLKYILRTLVREAYAEHQAGRVDEAIATYTRVIEMHPNYAEAMAYRAAAYDSKGQAKLAEDDCLRAIEIDPTYIQAYRTLDHVLFRQKRLDEIVNYWGRYLALKPRDADALLERSGTYYHKGQMDLAKRDLATACHLGNQKACQTQKRFN